MELIWNPKKKKKLLSELYLDSLDRGWRQDEEPAVED